MDPVAEGVSAAGLLPREVVGVRRTITQRVDAHRHAVGIRRIYRGSDEAQWIGDTGLVPGIVIGLAGAVI